MANFEASAHAITCKAVAGLASLSAWGNARQHWCANVQAALMV